MGATFSVRTDLKSGLKEKNVPFFRASKGNTTIRSGIAIKQYYTSFRISTTMGRYGFAERTQSTQTSGQSNVSHSIIRACGMNNDQTDPYKGKPNKAFSQRITRNRPRNVHHIEMNREQPGLD